MAHETKFRRILPVLQTVIAISFGGWGLRIRNSVLSRPFFGDSIGWDTTARFHQWPWPFKFAVIQNTPAFLVGLLLSWPIDSIKRDLPEWISLLPSLLLAPVLWYLIGAWLDRKEIFGHSGGAAVNLPWVVLSIVTAVSLLAAVCSGWLFGSYTTFIPLGIAYWAGLGIAMLLFDRYRKRFLGRY